MNGASTEYNKTRLVAREGITLYWLSETVCEGELNSERYTGIFHGGNLNIVKNSNGKRVAYLKMVPAAVLNTKIGSLTITWKGKWGNLWIAGVDVRYENGGHVYPGVTLFAVKKG